MVTVFYCIIRNWGRKTTNRGCNCSPCSNVVRRQWWWWWRWRKPIWRKRTNSQFQVANHRDWGIMAHCAFVYYVWQQMLDI